MLGVLLLTLLTGAAIGVTQRSGFPAGQILWCVLSALLGGALGAAPGAYLLLGATVFHATGTGQLRFYLSGDMPLVIFLAGGAVGATAALLLLDRLGGRETPLVRVGLAGLLAFATGTLAGYLALLLGQQSPYEVAILILIPVSVAAEMVAGYGLVACRP
jgi:hypothetical protein